MKVAPSLSSLKELYILKNNLGIILKSEGHSENEFLYLTVLSS